MSSAEENSKRIAKNTLLLYVRLLLTLAIGLFTSRIILNVLGIQDYGVNNIVAGFVSMFSLLTGSLSTAISRFLTFTLGEDDVEKLKRVFTTSVLIQIVMAITVSVIIEVVGIWFLNSHLNIPPSRLYAANWVFHLSVLAFAITLISVPYNACIIAHEKMGVYAYMGIFDVTMKLVIVYLLYVSPFDKLISYSVLFVCVSIIDRIIYGIYCKKHFEECNGELVFDKKLLKDMTGFAGWNLLGSASTVLNNQGVNVIINIFFGVTVNAARGISNQLEGIVKQFVINFTTAINPQITKSYAAEDYMYMNTLIRSGGKYSVCLMLLFTIPFLFETETILKLWLGEYPDYAPIFLRLTLIGSIIDMSGNSLAVAVWASGRIKKYYIYIGTLGLLTIPLTYCLFKLGYPPYFSYISYIVTYSIIQVVRLFIAKTEIPFQIMLYVKEVFFRTTIIAVIPIAITSIPYFLLENGTVKTLVDIIISVVMCLVSIYILGLGNTEKLFVRNKIRGLLRI